MLTGINMKEKKKKELGHSYRLEIHFNPSKIYVDPGI